MRLVQFHPVSVEIEQKMPGSKDSPAMDEDDSVAGLKKIPALNWSQWTKRWRDQLDSRTSRQSIKKHKSVWSVCLLGGGGTALAGAKIVDVAHTTLLQRHRSAAGGDAHHCTTPCSTRSVATGAAASEIWFSFQSFSYPARSRTEMGAGREVKRGIGDHLPAEWRARKSARLAARRSRSRSGGAARKKASAASSLWRAATLGSMAITSAFSSDLCLVFSVHREFFVWKFKEEKEWESDGTALVSSWTKDFGIHFWVGRRATEILELVDGGRFVWNVISRCRTWMDVRTEKWKKKDIWKRK